MKVLGVRRVGKAGTKQPRGVCCEDVVVQYPYVDEEHAERDALRVGRKTVLVERTACLCMHFVDEEHEEAEAEILIARPPQAW